MGISAAILLKAKEQTHHSLTEGSLFFSREKSTFKGNRVLLTREVPEVPLSNCLGAGAAQKVLVPQRGGYIILYIYIYRSRV